MYRGADAAPLAVFVRELLLVLRNTIQVLIRSNKDLTATDGRGRAEIFCFRSQTIRRQLFKLVRRFDDMDVTAARHIIDFAVTHDRR